MIAFRRRVVALWYFEEVGGGGGWKIPLAGAGAGAGGSSRDFDLVANRQWRMPFSGQGEKREEEEERDIRYPIQVAISPTHGQRRPLTVTAHSRYGRRPMNYRTVKLRRRPETTGKVSDPFQVSLGGSQYHNRLPSETKQPTIHIYRCIAHPLATRTIKDSRERSHSMHTKVNLMAPRNCGKSWYSSTDLAGPGLETWQ